MLLFGYFAELTSLVAKFTLQSKLQSEFKPSSKLILDYGTGESSPVTGKSSSKKYHL
jgi:hypothetical protein